MNLRLKAIRLHFSNLQRLGFQCLRNIFWSVNPKAVISVIHVKQFLLFLGLVTTECTLQREQKKLFLSEHLQWHDLLQANFQFPKAKMVTEVCFSKWSFSQQAYDSQSIVPLRPPKNARMLKNWTIRTAHGSRIRLTCTHTMFNKIWERLQLNLHQFDNFRKGGSAQRMRCNVIVISKCAQRLNGKLSVGPTCPMC